jgi:hypothetical protein
MILKQDFLAEDGKVKGNVQSFQRGCQDTVTVTVISDLGSLLYWSPLIYDFATAILGQLQYEDIEWKITEINNLQLLNNFYHCLV